MLKKTFIICLYLCYYCGFSYSQDTIIVNNKFIQHSLFVEFFGSSAQYYNITYDCAIALNKKNRIAIAAGVGYIPPISEYTSIGISLQANYLYGQKHYLEIGTGITIPTIYYPTWLQYTYTDGLLYDLVTSNWIFSTRDVLIPVRIGYRYQKNNGGLFWKIAFVPLFSMKNTHFLDMPFLPSAGVAIGYTFKTNKKGNQVVNNR